MRFRPSASAPSVAPETDERARWDAASMRNHPTIGLASIGRSLMDGTLPLVNQLSPAEEKSRLFRSLFRGRQVAGEPVRPRGANVPGRR